MVKPAKEHSSHCCQNEGNTQSSDFDSLSFVNETAESQNQRG